MFDKNLVLSILMQIKDTLQIIDSRAGRIQSVEDFTNSAPGMEALDSICMRFMVVGEALKNIDKITGGSRSTVRRGTGLPHWGALPQPISSRNAFKKHFAQQRPVELTAHTVV